MDPKESAYPEEARTHFMTRVKYRSTLSLLNQLMAITNRDGGHKADTFPTIDEAVENCILTVTNLIHKG